MKTMVGWFMAPDWVPCFHSQTCDPKSPHSMLKANSAAKSATSSETRETARQAGEAWATGSMGQLSARTPQGAAGLQAFKKRGQATHVATRPKKRATAAPVGRETASAAASEAA